MTPFQSQKSRGPAGSHDDDEDRLDKLFDRSCQATDEWEEEEETGDSLRSKMAALSEGWSCVRGGDVEREDGDEEKPSESM